MSEFEDALSKQRPNCMSGFALAELRGNRYQSHILHRINELEGCYLFYIIFTSQDVTLYCLTHEMLHVVILI